MIECAEMELLIQADLDGELGAADAAHVSTHVRRCAACAAVQAELAAVSARVRGEARRYVAPITAREGLRKSRLRGAGAGVAFALAACLAVVVLRTPSADPTAELIVAEHIRALQPGHLLDVLSTDQHNVKPWFDGRLDAAPPVRDLRAQGFDLAGGRLDYAAGRPAAALVYRRRQHVIDLFVWPEAGGGRRRGTYQGYNFVAWHAGGMAFWAVSDLNATELGAFAQLVEQGQ